MLRYISLFIFLFCFYYTNSLYALSSSWAGISEAQLRLISPISKAGDSPEILLGLQYKLEKGWKTYWHTPGEGGLPQTIKWDKSENIESVEILWPVPKNFEILGIQSIGYEQEIIFPLKIKLEDLKKQSFFSFDINFLTCKDICIPGSAHLELILPSGKGDLTKYSFLIEKHLSKIPNVDNIVSGLKLVQVSASSNKKFSIINIQASSDIPFNNPKIFLGNNIGLPIINPEYIFSTNRKEITAKFIYDEPVFDYKSNFDLSVVLSDNDKATKYITTINSDLLSHSFIFNYPYLYIVLTALLGGLILNLMPCVLPILSIKLMSLLKHNNQSTLIIRKSFFITAMGIILSFLILSIILVFLKLGGISIGWGMQFQQPIFLMIIVLVLFLFSLNLLGFFEFKLHYISGKLISISSKNKSFYSDFFNGFFATLLATPCSAPFVGTAITAAFMQSSYVMVGIFFFMGLGMSSPYILMSIFPKLITFLPKPGSWMNKLKYFLSLLLFGTIIWIGSILINHFNHVFIIIIILLGCILTASFKYLNNFKYSLITLIIIIFFALNFIPQLRENKYYNEENWSDLTTVNIQELVEDNKIVFVDITAEWCATCQFNKFNVINSSLINNAFNKNNVIKIRGDWTKPNKQIEEYLNSYNRFAIPFNVMYSADYPNGIIFSELLLSKDIINTLELMIKEN